jgi:hypothetical protein
MIFTGIPIAISQNKRVATKHLEVESFGVVVRAEGSVLQCLKTNSVIPDSLVITSPFLRTYILEPLGATLVYCPQVLEDDVYPIPLLYLIVVGEESFSDDGKFLLSFLPIDTSLIPPYDPASFIDIGTFVVRVNGVSYEYTKPLPFNIYVVSGPILPDPSTDPMTIQVFVSDVLVAECQHEYDPYYPKSYSMSPLGMYHAASVGLLTPLPGSGRVTAPDGDNIVGKTSLYDGVYSVIDHIIITRDTVSNDYSVMLYDSADEPLNICGDQEPTLIPLTLHLRAEAPSDDWSVLTDFTP